VTACDAFNAMSTDRPHRTAMSLPESVVELRESAGTQLDPQVVQALIAVVWDPLAPAR
jgi:HD-GYP domain-containing protein (c-di-GMP phosphodiesterase class II)